LSDLYTIVKELQRRMTEGGVYSKYFTDEDTRELYPKHWQFFDAGKNYRQRMFRAANRVGKTTAAGCELVYHLTGEYPKDWKGKTFDGCTSWWVCGKSSETVRQILQPLLLGPVGQFGTGLIPKDTLEFSSLSDAKKSSTGVSSFRVKHKSGGYSQVEFKTYEQGRQAFEGTERSIWMDEEPPLDVYSECLLRTMTGDNCLMLTFTPLKGASDVVKSFSAEGVYIDGEVGPGKFVATCTWDDVPHLDEEAKAELLASIPPFQRDARSNGIPSLGAGAIYPVPESEFVISPQPIPKHWKRCYGMDVGSKTAAVWLAIDPDGGEIWAYTEYYKEREEPSIHTTGIKAKGEWVPGAIDPASRGRSQIDGQQLMEMYENLGLNLVKAVNAVEAGLYTVWELLSTGRLKVFSNCSYLLQEMRGYIRDEKGQVVKKADHLCDAMRYAVMTRDIAENEGPLNNSSGMPTYRPRI
jgi:phage terminase large subunit-like protein